MCRGLLMVPISFSHHLQLTVVNITTGKARLPRISLHLVHLISNSAIFLPVGRVVLLTVLSLLMQEEMISLCHHGSSSCRCRLPFLSGIDGTLQRSKLSSLWMGKGIGKVCFKAAVGFLWLTNHEVHRLLRSCTAWGTHSAGMSLNRSSE